LTSPGPIPAREREFFEAVQARRLRPPRTGFLDGTLRRMAAVFAEAHLREEIARRPGAAQRIDPRARLLATLLFLVSTSLATSLPALAAHALLAAAAVVASRIRPREILGAGLLIALLFSTLMALPATLNLTSGGHVVLPVFRFEAARQVGPYAIPATIGVSVEGLLTATTFLLRTLASVTAVLCLTLSTRWTALLASLRWFRLPAVFLHTAGMTVRYLHLLLRQSEEAHLGKKSRTICRRPLASDQMWVGSRIAAAWEKSLQLMTDVTDAMTARGFTGEFRVPAGRTLAPTDWACVMLVAALCVGAHLA
jgi:energy-coupling factor transporter transmembrane protein EcfT